MKNNKLDILLMCDNGLDTVGGEQESTKIIINGIKKKFNLGVIQPGNISKRQLGVEYFELTSYTRIKHLIKNPIAFFIYMLKVRRIINMSNPKIIHTQAQVSFFIVALLKKLRFISNDIKLVHTERGLYTKYSNFFKNIFYFFMKNLNTLVTTTEFNMRYWKNGLEKRGFLLNYRVIENTAGELFEIYDESLSTIDEEKFTIGFAGRFCEWKNWPLAVEISKKINKMIGGNINIKMAVGCLDERSLNDTKEMFKELKETFGERFKGDINITIEEMDKFYYGIDLFILTSNYNTESFGRTLVEAMSRKTIVLTTNAGGSVEVVGNKDNVCETIDDFVDKILYFYNDKNIMRFEKENNLRRVNQVYSLENNIDKHLEMYLELIK